MNQNKHTSILCTLLLLTVAFKSECQNPAILKENIKMLDSAESVVRNEDCKDSLIYPKKYSSSKVKRDLLVVSFLNRVYAPDFSIHALESDLPKSKSIIINRNDKLNGLIKIIHLSVGSDNLDVELSLECIDDIIIAKNCTFRPNNSGSCGLHGGYILDFKFLKNFVAKNLTFKIRISDLKYLKCDSFFDKNLEIAAERHKDHLFVLSDSTNNPETDFELKKQFENKYSCCYNFQDGNEFFVTLIKNQKISLIQKLLYSPNYLYSIHAMEALIFLQSKGQVTLNDEMKKRFEILKQSNYPIVVRESYDYFRTVEGYRALKTSNEAVIKKYQQTLTKGPIN